VGGWAIHQLWLFWLAPLIGGALGGVIYLALFGDAREATLSESVERAESNAVA
jgi:hypothetical protein